MDRDIQISLNLVEIVKLDDILEFFGNDILCQSVRDRINLVLTNAGIGQVDGCWRISRSSNLIKKSLEMNVDELKNVWDIVDRQVKFRGGVDRTLPTVLHKLSLHLERQGFKQTENGWQEIRQDPK